MNAMEKIADAEHMSRMLAAQRSAFLRDDAAFSALPFDHLMFTGNTAVGHAVMKMTGRATSPTTMPRSKESEVDTFVARACQEKRTKNQKK
ncbi:hypothetical protein H4S14_003371 [Agrobacterium vitis]|nr:hypothetical protein [Agrobacterium vitis]MBE1439606.1 hypothetical protein [Agrobacterium vitis]